jgi:hypothetical protein
MRSKGRGRDQCILKNKEEWAGDIAQGVEALGSILVLRERKRAKETERERD